jgi:hypothetical protein
MHGQYGMWHKGYLWGIKRPVSKTIEVMVFLRNGNLAELKNTVIGMDV